MYIYYVFVYIYIHTNTYVYIYIYIHYSHAWFRVHCPLYVLTLSLRPKEILPLMSCELRHVYIETAERSEETRAIQGPKKLAFPERIEMYQMSGPLHRFLVRSNTMRKDQHTSIVCLISWVSNHSYIPESWNSFGSHFDTQCTSERIRKKYMFRCFRFHW